MNAIAGMAELMLREDLPDAARRHALTIKQAGENLLAIINEILDFSKIESGKLEIVPVDYLFSSLINDVISIIRMKLVDSEVLFAANIDCNIPNALYGDEIKIRQIFLNILSNAVKYTEKGHVSLTVSAKGADGAESIESSKCAEGGMLLDITVVDTGRGIKPEDMEKLFGDYAQVDMAANKGIEGTGLGLSITRSLVKAMGGDISAASEYGSGSTFTVTLPQKARGPQPLAAVETPGEKSALVYEPREIYADSILRAIEGLGAKAELASSPAGLRDELARVGYAFVFIASAVYGGAREICQTAGKGAKIVLLAEFGEMAAEPGISVLAMPACCISIANILNGGDDPFSYSSTGSTTALFTAPEASVLVVDDIGTNLSVAQGLLAPYQMKVDLCLSGREAIDAIAAKKYDLVLMDHMMPEMDGIEATAKIRALGPYYLNLPIVALTANAVSGAKEMFLQNGFNDFLAKPINTVKLNSILEKWLPKEKQRKVEPKGAALLNGAALLKGISLPKADAPPAQGAAPGIVIEGLDTKTGQARSGGALESYMQTLAIFRKDGQNKIAQIKKCLDAADLPLYVTYVHALKSASANVGAGILSEMAGALEAAGAKGDLGYIQAHTADMLHALETVLANIGAAIAAMPPKGKEGTADMAQIKAELAKLSEAIDRLDPRAISEAAKALRVFAGAPGIGGGIENILQNTLIGEYGEAAAGIKTALMDN
jgi:CheY-like chemotaxis protein/HPt (histidine-containing phosphotransfer) domain-containing protein/anti-sigma regulatory factor (Ser/Thr protein kinase)